MAPLAGTAVLSPRLYSKLTVDGTAVDGAGILFRFETELRRRAHELWLTTGEQREEKNWLAAERSLIKREDGSTVAEPEPESTALEEFQELQRSVAQQRQQLEDWKREWAAAEARGVELEMGKERAEARVAELEAMLQKTAVAKMLHTHDDKVQKPPVEENKVPTEVPMEVPVEVPMEVPIKESAEGQVRELEKLLQARDKEREGLQSKLEANEKEIAELKQQLVRPEMVPKETQFPDLRSVVEEKTTEEKAKLQEILDKKQVEVDSDSNKLVFKEPLDFKPIGRGHEPEAEFKDKAKALGILKDAAALLDFFSTALVAVEGHTATPDDKLDEWAQKLATNRANMVKTTLESFGVQESRLTAVGKPGKFGSGHTEVLLQVTKL